MLDDKAPVAVRGALLSWALHCDAYTRRQIVPHAGRQWRGQIRSAKFSVAALATPLPAGFAARRGRSNIVRRGCVVLLGASKLTASASKAGLGWPMQGI